jgi:hypothetical protein
MKSQALKLVWVRKKSWLGWEAGAGSDTLTTIGVSLAGIATLYFERVTNKRDNIFRDMKGQYESEERLIVAGLIKLGKV